MQSLADLPLHRRATVVRIDGLRWFRRRLMEMGLVPGTQVMVVNVAPLGDPLEIEVRGDRLSVRKQEASLVAVRP
jgi:ferrous iron transport protein A